MKRTMLVVCAAFLGAASLGAGTRQVVEGIVVRVNDRILTIADMRQRALEKAAENGKPVTPDQYADLVNESADELCLLERAKELKIEVGDDEVKAAVDQLKEQNHVPDDATWEKMLANWGLTPERLRSRLRDSIMVNRTLAREVGNLPITEEELRQRYQKDKEEFRVPERFHLEHLVIPPSADPAEEAARMAEASRLVAAARAGGDFLSLVKDEVAAGRGSGGDLGVIALSDLRPEVRAQVEKLKPGQISDPFASPAGIHVVRVTEIIPPSYKPFEKVEDEIREKELSERYHERLRGIVDGLKRRYVVEVHPELFTAK